MINDEIRKSKPNSATNSFHKKIVTPAIVIIPPINANASDIIDMLHSILDAIDSQSSNHRVLRGLGFPHSIYHTIEVQRRALEATDPDIIVATPNRLRDMLSEELITLEKTRAVVLDEADKADTYFSGGLARDNKCADIFARGKDIDQLPIFHTLPDKSEKIVLGTRRLVLEPTLLVIWGSIIGRMCLIVWNDVKTGCFEKIIDEGWLW